MLPVSISIKSNPEPSRRATATVLSFTKVTLLGFLPVGKILITSYFEFIGDRTTKAFLFSIDVKSKTWLRKPSFFITREVVLSFKVKLKCPKVLSEDISLDSTLSPSAKISAFLYGCRLRSKAKSAKSDRAER